MSDHAIPVEDCLSMIGSARKGIEVKMAARANQAKRLHEEQVVWTLIELDRVIDDLLEAGRSAQTTRFAYRRERDVRSALERHALACSRMLDLVEELDSYSFVDPIRIVRPTREIVGHQRPSSVHRVHGPLPIGVPRWRRPSLCPAGDGAGPLAQVLPRPAKPNPQENRVSRVS